MHIHKRNVKQKYSKKLVMKSDFDQTFYVIALPMLDSFQLYFHALRKITKAS